MKTTVYIVLAFLFAWLVIDKPEEHKAIELPDPELKSEANNFLKLEYEWRLDSIVEKVEQNHKYLKHASYESRK